jgi:hypothetical protein
VESSKIGAKIDKIPEKRQFPMFFLQTFQFINVTYVPTDYNNKKWNILKKWPKHSIHPLALNGGSCRWGFVKDLVDVAVQVVPFMKITHDNINN